MVNTPLIKIVDRPDIVSVTAVLGLGLVFVVSNGITVSPIDSAPPGQALYRLAKLFGLVASYLLCIQILAGLANAMQLRRLWPWGRKGHVFLFTALAVALVCHISFFLMAVSFRTGEFPIHLLVPDFTHGYYRTSISLGSVALLGIAITATAGWCRLKNKPLAKSIHALAYIALALAIVHSTNIGSETRSYAALIVLSATSLLVIGLLYARWWATKSKNA